MNKLIIVCSFIYSILGLHVGAYDETYTEKLRYLSCGRRNVMEGDIRTSTPWSAVIFYRGDEQSKPRFFTTGVIIGPTTILTVAPGPLGGPLRGSGEQDKLHPPSKFIVGVGLKSTSFDSQDSHSQLVDVHFLEPHVHHNSENEHYHLLLYHLRTILDLRTPYVRTICLIPRSYYVDQLPALENHAGLFPTTWSGYTTTLSKLSSYNYDLALTTFTFLSSEYCKKLFKLHYKKESFEKFNLFCTRKLLATDSVFEKSIETENKTDLFPFHKARGEESQACYVHGSVASSAYNQRVFLSGLTVLIPGRRRDRCNDHTVYMSVEMGYYYDWLARAVECSPSKYSCGDGSGGCVKISNVCNGFKDCGNGQDENPAMCYAQNRCDELLGKGGNVSQFFCGVTDSCIAANKLCDGSVDCDEGGDETLERCDNVQIPLAQLTEEVKCPLPAEYQGVKMSCFNERKKEIPCEDAASVNSSIELVCKNLFVSYYDYSFVRVKCKENGEFSRIKPFSCVQECGTYETKSINGSSQDSQSSGTKLYENMPWNILMLVTLNASRNGVNVAGSAKAICSAVLIDQSFAITSASCLKRKQGTGIQLLLGPIATSDEGISDQLEQAETIQQSWVSKSDSTYTDLELIHISPRAKPEGSGQRATPCFLSNPKTFGKAPSLNSTGWITRFKRSVASAPARMTGNQTDSQLYIYQARVASFSECTESLPLENLPKYAFCVAFVAAEENQRINIGTGFYTRQRYKDAGKIRYNLKGISITQSRVSRRPNNSSKLIYYQWFTGIEPFTDWITEVLEQNY